MVATAMSVSISSCSKDSDSEPNPPEGPDTPTVTEGSLERYIVGTWKNEYFDGNYYETVEIKLYSDHKGVMREIDEDGTVDSEPFTWTINEQSRVISMVFDGETERSQILGISPKYAVLASDSEERLFIRQGNTSATYNVVDPSDKIVGTWVGYQEEETAIMMQVEINANGSSRMDIFNLDGRLISSDDAVWMPGPTGTINTYLVDASSYDVDSEPYKVLKSTDACLVLNRSGHHDVYSFLKKGTEKRITKDMVPGKWQTAYSWSEDYGGWNYDLLTMSVDGTGLYSENAPTSDPDTFSFKWQLAESEQVLTITYRNGEYGYKPDEPEYESIRCRIFTGNNEIVFGLDDNDLITMVRQ